MKATGELRKVQLLQLRVLDEIDKLCNILGVKYFLIAGSLLGAIRHKGFIPWDLDIDIAMFRNDYEKLIRTGNNYINKAFFIQSDFSDKNHLAGIAKVRVLGTLNIEKGNKPKSPYNGFYIDIFPLDDVKETPNKIGFLKAKLIKLMIRVKAFRRGKKHSSTFIRSIVSFFLAIITSFLKTETILAFINKIMIEGNGKGYQYVTNYCSKYGVIRQCMHKEVYGKPVKVEFEGKFYNAPQKYIYWLKKIYGNYRDIPKNNLETESLPNNYINDLGDYKSIE